MACIRKLRTATYFVFKLYFSFGLINERVHKNSGNTGFGNMSSKGDYSLFSLTSVTHSPRKQKDCAGLGSLLDCFQCLFSSISKCVNIRKLMF